MLKETDSKAKDKQPIEESSQDKKQQQQQQESKSSMSFIKKGDYTIHILIEEIKNAFLKNNNLLPSPCIKMSCFKKSQRTTNVLVKAQDYIFNEHFYFSKTDLSVDQLNKECILIEAYDQDNSSKADYLGVYEFDLETIYSRPDHSIKNTWIALANPNGENMERVNGFLKLSLSVLNDDDPRIDLKAKQLTENECLVPPQIILKYKQVSINIFRGEEISDESDTNKKVNKKCNCFIEAAYMGVKRSTTIVDMVKDIIEWNQVIDIPVCLPAVGKAITFHLIDKDLIGTNIIGSFEINIDNILLNQYSSFTYINVYGSPVHSKGKNFDDMNSNANVGSKWKGRILVKIDYCDTERPVSRVEKISNETLLAKATKVNRSIMWTLHIKLYDLFYLPSESDSYGVKIAIQENEKIFPVKKANQRNASFNLTAALQCFTLTSQLEEISDIFIYLLNDKQKPICFQRLKANQFHLNESPMIIKLIPDPCIGIIKSDCITSGLAKVKLLLLNKASDKIDNKILSDFKGDEEEEDLENLKNVHQAPKKQQLNSYAICSNVYMSKYLISGDNGGSSDLFVEVSFSNQTKKTEIKGNCINGIWNQSLVFDNIMMDIKDISTWPIFFIKIIDSDYISDDFLAYNYIWLSDASYVINSTVPPKAKWHQLRLTQSNRPQGQILLSFFILDLKSKANASKINIIPELTTYAFELNILGMRNLKPLSIIPIKKSYVSFDINSLNFDSSQGDLLNPKTEPGDSGNNPNMSSVIQFNCKMPVDFTFLPFLQCEVYDYILAGLINTSLGMFEIDLRNIIESTTKGIESDLAYIFNESRNNNSNQNIGVIEFDDKKTKLPNQSHQDQLDLGDADDSKLNVPLVKREEGMKLNDIPINKIPQEEIKNNLFNSEYFLLKPVFQTYSIPGEKKGSKKYKEYLIENEKEMPDDTLYYPLGFNKYYSTHEGSVFNNEGENKKHYRRIFRKELENVPELKLASPFIKASLRRDRDSDTKPDNPFIEAISSEDNKILKKYSSSSAPATKNIKEEELMNTKSLDSRSYGTFKAIARICNANTINKYNEAVKEFKEKNPYLMSELKYHQKYENISKKMLTKTPILVRLYVLRLNNLEKRDVFSDPDPYIKISIGDEEKVNEKKNSLSNQTQCDWYKVYDIPTTLPGNGSLTISVYDYDPVFADELIGMTSIDLEDRYFDPEWTKLEYKPIEIRNLNHPDYKQKQGDIMLFLELIQKADRGSVNAKWNIDPEPMNTLEMRLIIWETEDIEMCDAEGTSDIYVVAYLDANKPQSTDIHYRCQTGNGSFNWRMIIPVTTPRQSNRLTFLVYDNDILARDDFICSGSLNITRLIRNCNMLDVPITFDKTYYDGLSNEEKIANVTFASSSEDLGGKKFWVDLSKNNKKAGRVLVSLELFPMWKAQSNLVGKGRTEPNVCPYLPPPTGRIVWTLNPLTMLNQMIGPKLRRKFYQILCCICCIIYLIIFVPFVIYYVGSELINPFNYI